MPNLDCGHVYRREGMLREELDSLEGRLAALDSCLTLGRHTCKHCGSTYGMEVWDRERCKLPADAPLPQLYRGLDREWPGCHCLYSPCPTCNGAGDIPHWFSPVDGGEVEAWLEAECQCSYCRWRRGEPVLQSDWADEDKYPYGGDDDTD